MRNADKDGSAVMLSVHPQTPPDHNKEGQTKVSCWEKAKKWLKYEDRSKWLEDMRGMLSLVATMIATMTFQVALNPPGGVIQANEGVTIKNLETSFNNDRHPFPGVAVLAYVNPGDYRRFQICNSVSFVASLSVSLLLISGIPLNHRFYIWILSIGMIIALSCLALTFVYGMALITPWDYSHWKLFENIYIVIIYAWTAMIGVVVLFLTIRFLVWFVTKCVRVLKNCYWMATRTWRA